MLPGKVTTSFARGVLGLFASRPGTKSSPLINCDDFLHPAYAEPFSIRLSKRTDGRWLRPVLIAAHPLHGSGIQPEG